VRKNRSVTPATRSYIRLFPCDNNQYTPAYLDRHCAEPFLLEKKLNYSCELCLTVARTKQKEKVKEKYVMDILALPNKLDKTKEGLKQDGQIISLTWSFK